MNIDESRGRRAATTDIFLMLHRIGLDYIDQGELAKATAIRDAMKRINDETINYAVQETAAR